MEGCTPERWKGAIEMEGCTPERWKGTVMTNADDVRGLHVDLARIVHRTRPANLPRELLIKAIKAERALAKTFAQENGTEQHPWILDATAGLGEDSYLLAVAGFNVTLFERNPVIAALCRDGLQAALKDKRLASVAQHMTLIEGDSQEILLSPARKNALLAAHDKVPPLVVLLDPMFPETGKSAAVKKKLQMLRKLERPCTDEQALFDAACAVSPHKIVVKRPLKGPYFAHKQPSYSLKGKAIRFDCYS